MKKIILGIIAIAAIMLASCASADRYPEEIKPWVKGEKSNEFIHGLGVSTIKDDLSDAVQQATLNARAALLLELRAQVGTIGENDVNRATAQGETERVALFNNNIKFIAEQAMRDTRTIGPFEGGKGETFIIVYVKATAAKEDIQQQVQKVFSSSIEEMNRLMGN